MPYSNRILDRRVVVCGVTFVKDIRGHFTANHCKMFKKSTDPPLRKRKIADLENLGRSGGATELKIFEWNLVDTCGHMYDHDLIMCRYCQ